MIDFKIQGVIFDVDETLLDTFPDGPRSGLHEAARRLAAQEVGRKIGNEKLANFSLEDAYTAFDSAKVSTLEAAVWNMLLMSDAVSGELVSGHPLLKEITELKNIYFQKTLKQYGKPILDAERFVRGLALSGLGDHLAIASSAIRNDIVAFLELAGITDLIPESRIQSFETVKNFKPHSEPFDNAFKSLGLPDSARTHTLVFEDDPRGITSAKAAGLYVCAITSHKFTKQALQKLETTPDLIADSYAEFSKVLSIPLAPLDK